MFKHLFSRRKPKLGPVVAVDPGPGHDCTVEYYVDYFTPALNGTFTCVDYEAAGSGVAYVDQYIIGGQANLQTSIDEEGCGVVNAGDVIAELGLMADALYLDPVYSCI